MNRSKVKGTAWETAITNYLIAAGWIHAERRACNGRLDRGDIAGIPGVVIEAKNAKTINLAGWMNELDTEVVNDGAAHGALWVKRRGYTSPADGYVVMHGVAFIALLQEAGY